MNQNRKKKKLEAGILTTVFHKVIHYYLRLLECRPSRHVLARTSSLVTGSLYEMRGILWYHLISMVCILLWSSAVRVHDSHVYRKIGVTRERISRIFELREILLSFQNGFNLVNAAVVCAILESISGLEPSTVITEPWYLKLVTVLSFCPFTFISMLMPLVLFVISLVFSALISMN